jgi:hypothetical protein
VLGVLYFGIAAVDTLRYFFLLSSAEIPGGFSNGPPEHLLINTFLSALDPKPAGDDWQS